MPHRTNRQNVAHRLNRRHVSSPDNEENTPLTDSSVLAESSTRKINVQKLTPKAQIIQKDIKIAELEAIVSQLSAEVLRLQHDYDALSHENKNLIDQKQSLSVTNKCLKSFKRKADAELTEELTKRRKRIKRLERDRNVKQDKDSATLSTFNSALDEKSTHINQLEHSLASALSCIQSRDTTIVTLQTSLRETQSLLTSTRNRLYASRKQAERAKASLKEIEKAYRQLRTWYPMKNGQYSADSRELARVLTSSGCAADKVELVVESCARTFGIIIAQRFMSRRTVGWAIDEGGKYGEIQLGREIIEAPGFVESSDGTTHRGITVESRHITLLVPTYAPDADDSDKSTWRYQTRFVEVAPALDHTGKRQFEGTMEAANRIADTYTRSPLAGQEKRIMDKNDYWRKKLGEHKDHAADGKKEFQLSSAHKKEIVIRDMGRVAMDDADVATSHILTTMASITNPELAAAGKLSLPELAALSTHERSALLEQVLEQKIGTEKFESLTPAQQSNACTHYFGGCCCHKDLNVLRYGVVQMESVYATHDIPAPILLANKANTAIIDLNKNPDSAALQNAIDSSSRGAIKLLSLLGSLLRHKDGERGYQDKCNIYMRQQKLELFDLEAPGKFPDVSNTRYGCHTYAAAEVICFPGLIQELVTEIIDGKTKSGQANHVEQNILKGLNCSATVTELFALALYGVSVSWPYMAMVRGTKEKPINLVSLTDLHRRLPLFCSHVAANPHILFDPNTPLDVLTIDGRPFRDQLLIRCIRQLRPELPNLLLITSNLFTGCAKGWIQFTPEFHVGGTFDSLTPEQRAILWIPTTNDCNEGMLGSYRVHMRYHPNSTAHSFSNQTRTERNNTEAFIKKFCDAAVEKFVMREVRKDGAGGSRAKFRKAFAALQKEKAANALKRRQKTAERKRAAAVHLAQLELEFDVNKIRALTSDRLKDQLRIYRDVLKDEILRKKLWKEMGTAPVRRALVFEARERELAKRQVQTRITPYLS
ncbi:hypothetical protein B0H11DRAFT_2236415 [Mycena galericulata]|nr:hypothetical protein B0H11DRAFT_2236415 [Mycena galericulata]